MGGKCTEARNRASMKYQRARAQIKITVSKEQRSIFQAHAERRGMSLTALIVSLLEKDIAGADRQETAGQP